MTDDADFSAAACGHAIDGVGEPVEVQAADGQLDQGQRQGCRQQIRQRGGCRRFGLAPQQQPHAQQDCGRRGAHKNP